MLCVLEIVAHQSNTRPHVVTTVQRGLRDRSQLLYVTTLQLTSEPKQSGLGTGAAIARSLTTQLPPATRSTIQRDNCSQRVDIERDWRAHKNLAHLRSILHLHAKAFVHHTRTNDMSIVPLLPTAKATIKLALL